MAENNEPIYHVPVLLKPSVDGMKLNELLKTIQPIQVIGGTETEITGVNIDSRLVKSGHLFMG